MGGVVQSSGLKIEAVKPATNKEWDATWINCDYATYFHSREWADIWRLYTDGFDKPAPEVVTFSDKKQALLPFTVQRRKNLIKTYFLSAEVQFGGWISTDTLEDEHTSLLVDYIDNKCSNLVWRWNPYCPAPVKMDVHDIYELEEDESYSIDLTSGFSEILKGCCHGHRCSYNKGKK